MDCWCGHGVETTDERHSVAQCLGHEPAKTESQFVIDMPLALVPSTSRVVVLLRLQAQGAHQGADEEAH